MYDCSSIPIYKFSYYLPSLSFHQNVSKLLVSISFYAQDLTCWYASPPSNVSGSFDK
jgi:hypothetical protein